MRRGRCWATSRRRSGCRSSSRATRHRDRARRAGAALRQCVAASEGHRFAASALRAEERSMTPLRDSNLARAPRDRHWRSAPDSRRRALARLAKRQSRHVASSGQGLRHPPGRARRDPLRLSRRTGATRSSRRMLSPTHGPYLHPIAAPDGKGVVTEFSPEHHKHQTGLYWGFTRRQRPRLLPQSAGRLLAAGLGHRHASRAATKSAGRRSTTCSMPRARPS